MHRICGQNPIAPVVMTNVHNEPQSVETLRLPGLRARCLFSVPKGLKDDAGAVLAV